MVLDKRPCHEWGGTDVFSNREVKLYLFEICTNYYEWCNF